MRLRTKLSFVLALLVFTLAVNVSVSVWSIRFLERELANPLQSIQSVMHHLHAIKRLGEQEIDIATQTTHNQDIAEHARSLRLLEQQSGDILRILESLPTTSLRSGINTIHNMRTRSAAITQLTDRWENTESRADAEALISALDQRHELIERVEGRILEDAKLAADYSTALQRNIYSILLVSLIGAIAIGLVMVMFIRRWVFAPIERLREGADRFASGEFDHKIPVESTDELGLLSEEFNRMGSLILTMQDQRIEQERLAAMGEMAQMTVHNLRTPLAGIRALAETTKDELDPDSDLQDLQQRIISTVDRFESWLKEMLRISAPLEMHLGEYSPERLVQGVINTHLSACESRGRSLRFTIGHAPQSAIGDPHHLEHAITTLLSNAIDFANESTEILAHLDTADSGDYWTLRVVDDGPMIPEHLHRAIFRPYFTTRKSGTGIGLAVCQRVIDQHQGQITVESPVSTTKQTGTAFEMMIPMDSSSKPKA